MKPATYAVSWRQRLWALTGPDILRCEYHNKADLVQHARTVALSNQPAVLRIEYRDGRIQAEHRYGATP